MSARGAVATLMLFMLTLLQPRPAHAVCESFIEAAAAGGVAIAAHAGGLTAMEEFFKATALVGGHTYMNERINQQLNNLENEVIKQRMHKFATDFETALKNITKQLVGGDADAIRQLSSMFDVETVNASARALQDVQAEALKQYQPDEESCRFDTAGRYNSYALRAAKATSDGASMDLSKIANNDKTTPAAKGETPLQKSRFDTSVSTFCDPNSNSGYAGCVGTSDPVFVNADKLPRTLWGRDTIDMTDEKTRKAVNAFIMNVTGVKVPDVMTPQMLAGNDGREQRQRNREYMAQIDSVGALVFGALGDTAPGESAPEIKAMRTKLGVQPCSAAGFSACASDKPSAKEIRRARIESLWDPNYFTSLYDSGASIKRKQIYLQAMNLMMLYQMIEKMEKISTVYAVETANMLDKADNSRGAGSAYGGK